MQRKFLLQVKQVHDYESEKGKSEGDYITYDGVDVSQLTELKCSIRLYTYINKRPKLILSL